MENALIIVAFVNIAIIGKKTMKTIAKVKNKNNNEITLILKDNLNLDIDKDYTIKIENIGKKRSLNANSYLWTLLDQMATMINSTKEILYKNYINQVGYFEVVHLSKKAVDFFTKNWQEKGVGWIVEKLNDYEDSVELLIYFGSSTYTTEQMTKLLDSVIFDCKTLGIETLDEIELKRIIESKEGK